MSLPDLMDGAVLMPLLASVGVEPLSDPEAVGNAYGFASARVALRARLADGTTADVVVKAWDAGEHGLGEVEFYGDWAPRLPVRLPVCHAMGASAHVGVLVLEDLRPARQGDELERVSRKDACAIAQSIGRVHAATVGAAAPLPPPRFGRLLPPEWHDSRRVGYIERWGLPDDELVQAVVVHSVLAEQVARSLWAGAPEGLTHSDLQLDNVLFTEEGPVIVDWSRPGWGPAAHDLSSLLLSGVDTEDYQPVIDAHREITATDDDQIDGAMLERLVIATLGTARWFPTTSRQEHLVEQGRRRVTEAASWLRERRPGLLHLLKG